MMNKQFIEEKGFKDWYKDLDSTTHIMGSDDIDYLASMYVLNKLFGCETTLFNDFSTIYHREDIDVKDIKVGQVVAVDMDLMKHKCFGNHVTYIKNPDSININNGILYGCKDYYNKFAGSTLITVMSLYDIPMCIFTDEQLELLICVDTAFKQYYYNNNTNKRFIYYYQDVLQCPEFIELLSKHKINYFYDIIKEYKLYKKIYINEDGYMQTEIELDKISDVFGIDLSLPNKKFIPFYHMQNRGYDDYEFRRKFHGKKDKIYSTAFTGCNYVMASTKF